MPTAETSIEFADFTTTAAYGDRGWKAYLGMRAEELKYWHNTPGKGRVFEKDSFHVSLPHEGAAKNFACTVATPSVGFIDDGVPGVQWERTSYDVWGRPGAYNYFWKDGGHYQYFAPVAGRSLHGSPFEGLLLGTDTKNYLQFLNVYFASIAATTEAFRTDPALLPSFSKIKVELIDGENETPAKNLGAFIENMNGVAGSYDPVIIARCIDNGAGLDRIAKDLKNGIAVCEAVSAQLSDEASPLFQKAEALYGKKKGWFAKGNRNEPLFQAWQHLINISPKPKPELA